MREGEEKEYFSSLIILLLFTESIRLPRDGGKKSTISSWCFEPSRLHRPVYIRTGPSKKSVTFSWQVCSIALERLRHINTTAKARPESPTATITWHASKYQGYILAFTRMPGEAIQAFVAVFI